VYNQQRKPSCRAHFGCSACAHCAEPPIFGRLERATPAWPMTWAAGHDAHRASLPCGLEAHWFRWSKVTKLGLSIGVFEVSLCRSSELGANKASPFMASGAIVIFPKPRTFPDARGDLTRRPRFARAGHHGPTVTVCVCRQRPPSTHRAKQIIRGRPCSRRNRRHPSSKTNAPAILLRKRNLCARMGAAPVFPAFPRLLGKRPFIDAETYAPSAFRRAGF